MNTVGELDILFKHDLIEFPGVLHPADASPPHSIQHSLSCPSLSFTMRDIPITRPGSGLTPSSFQGREGETSGKPQFS